MIWVFIDFNGAFSNLLWRVILDVEELIPRRVCMSNSVKEVERVVEKGCLQDSIGGPALWDICVDVLLWTLCARGIIVEAYTDLLTIVEGNARVVVESRATEIMSEVCEWALHVCMKVSESKTVCMVMEGGMEMMNRRVHVHESENVVKFFKFVISVKYLGMNVGVSMDFYVHIRGVREREGERESDTVEK